jgi:hypothetical protein
VRRVRKENVGDACELLELREKFSVKVGGGKEKRFLRREVGSRRWVEVRGASQGPSALWPARYARGHAGRDDSVSVLALLERGVP